MPDTLVMYGGAVKALGDGKVGGYLVRFSDETSPDLTGDYFTKGTDFDVEDGDRRSTYYAHGLDKKIGVKKIGTLTVKSDDVGVWVEAQLKMRDEYEQSIYDLAAKGKLGWSSGAPSHLVTRKSIEVKGVTVNEILTWPIAEGSLTPTPAEPRNDAIALKSLSALIGMDDAADTIKAIWSTAFQNNLPDASFAFIESGGKKDDDGKTTPRSLRHFPYKDADGKPDAAHVRNALARIPQSDLPDSAKASALTKVKAAAKELGIDSGDSKKQLPENWSTMDLLAFLESELNEDFGSAGSYGPFGDYCPSVYFCVRNLVEQPVDSVIYSRSDEPGDTFRRPYTITASNDAAWGDEEEVVQTTVYVAAVDGDEDDGAPPMMAGKHTAQRAPDVEALKGMLRGSMTLDDHADVVRDAMSGFATRLQGLGDLSIKAGRPMSAARHTKLRQAYAGMRTAHTAMEGHLEAINEMLLSTDPDAKKGIGEVEALRTQSLRLQSRQLGMTG